LSALIPIGRFAQLAGFTVRALRHYESQGLLLPARVDRESGYRFYGPEQLPDALRVRLLRALEMPLPEVVEVMREVGIDLGGAKPRLLTADLAEGAVRVITMGCAEECPVVSAPMEDWGLPDPAGQPLDVVREIRDDIDRRVRILLSNLET